MIIDAHTHIFPEPIAKKALSTVVGNTNGRLNTYTDGTSAGLIKSMDRAGIDYSVVLPVATSPGHWENILRWAGAIAAQNIPLIFFGSLHPLDPDYRKIIRKIKDAGLQGIKLHPGYQNYPADSKAAFRIYEEAANNDLVIHFHSGFDPSLPHCDLTSIERFSSVVKSFYKAKIVLAHAGGMDEWQKVADLLGGRGCYFDVAFVLEKMRKNDNARELYRQNEDYFIFGTDTPWRDQREYTEIIKNSVTLTRDQKDKIFYKNILKLIKI